MAAPVGLWLIGARGSLATTAAVGAAALSTASASTTGMVTALPPFRDALGPFELVLGGHDVVDVPLVKRAEALVEAGVVPAHLLAVVRHHLDDQEGRVRRGVDTAAGEHPARSVDRLRRDLLAFRADHGLRHVVVVNVASTEAPATPDPAHADLGDLRVALGAGRHVLPPSSLYAMAAFEAGCSFVDFTPSAGARLPALETLALERGVCHAGRDGKTGETLLKTALAPMFATRNLRVRSWAGTNLLGGGDGASLADPGRRRSKLESKARPLAAILGYDVEAPTNIDYVADLGEWKTAWDHITFEGFLGTRMRMQFSWEGCDSALAAPLVLDLARLVAAGHAAGRSGGVAELAFFFKDPWGTGEHRLERQFDDLVGWVQALGAAA